MTILICNLCCVAWIQAVETQFSCEYDSISDASVNEWNWINSTVLDGRIEVLGDRNRAIDEGQPWGSPWWFHDMNNQLGCLQMWHDVIVILEEAIESRTPLATKVVEVLGNYASHFKTIVESVQWF